ncbi:MAG: diguanylate cyclase, partial [Campylobacterota bacterium]|nr:diguanylate cyclase [Campylobacterota bacterium]
INGGNISILDINMTLIKVLFLSVFIGSFIAYIGYFVIKILKNSFDQFLIIYLIVIISFMIAEHFHIAGILSIVASVLTFKYLVKKEQENSKRENFDLNNDDIETSLISFIKNVPALTKKDFREYKKESEFIGIFANSIVFLIVANIIDVPLLLTYYKEILIVFAITSILRFFVIGGMIVKLNLPFRWGRALTYSGAKGALAIIMVHSLPEGFIYKELFDSIVVGNVLLTTFIYTISLMVHINYNKNNYKNDIKQSKESSSTKLTTKNLVELIEKDINTGAYNKTFIEDIMENELARVQRYKSQFSCIVLDIEFFGNMNDVYRDISTVINNKIRANDYFGKLTTNRFIIIASNTSLTGSVKLAEIMEDIFNQNDVIKYNSKILFGIAQAEDADSFDTMLEKLDEAVIKAQKSKTGNIEIET